MCSLSRRGGSESGRVAPYLDQRLGLAPQWLGLGGPRRLPDSVGADRTYSNGVIRAYLRRGGIRHAIPEKRDSKSARLRKGSRGGRPPGFDTARYKARNSVERAVNKLKQFRAVATRHERGYVYLGTVTAAALLIWLRC